MKRLLVGVALGSWLCGCPPGFDDLGTGDAGTAVDGGRDAATPDDAGHADGGADAGTDGGTVEGCDALLPCTRSCDGLFDSILYEPSFDAFPDTMRVARGTVTAEGGELVFERDSEEPMSSVSTDPMFSDAMLCARVRMPGGGEGISVNMFAIGLLTGSGGVELFLEGREEQLSFHSLEVLPDGVLLGRRDHAWTDAHEFVVLVYLSGETAYAEVLDTVEDASFTMSGTYRGEMRPAIGWFSATEPKLLEPVHLLEVRIGTPSAAALAVIER